MKENEKEREKEIGMKKNKSTQAHELCAVGKHTHYFSHIIYEKISQ